MSVENTSHGVISAPPVSLWRRQIFSLEKSWLGRIGRNSGWLFMARVVTQLQLAIFTLLAARRMGVTAFGQYAFISAVVVLGNVLTTFGTDTLIIRDLSRTRRSNDSRLLAALLIQIGLSVVFIGLILLWTVFIPNESSGTLLGLRLYSLTLLPLAFFSIFTAILRAWERMDLFLLSAGLNAALLVGGTWFVTRGPASLLPLIYFLLAVQLIAALGAGILCRVAIPEFSLLTWRVNRNILLWVWKKAWPLALLSILGIIYQRVGILGVSLMLGNAPSGLFTVATRTVEAFKIIHIAVLGGIFPFLSHQSSEMPGAQSLSKIFNLILWALMGLGILAASGMTFFAQPIVTLLFGPDYLPAVALLRLMAWMLIPYTISSCYSMKFILDGREKMALKATALGCGAALVFNICLINSMRLAGSGLAGLLGESILAGAFLVMRKKI